MIILTKLRYAIIINKELDISAILRFIIALNYSPGSIKCSLLFCLISCLHFEFNFSIVTIRIPTAQRPANIGCIFTGVKDGKQRNVYIYNVCDHQECYREVGSQAISYTTGVPAMIGASLVMNGLWKKPGVFTVEEFDPDPYMDALNKWGLPWTVDENPTLVD